MTDAHRSPEEQSRNATCVCGFKNHPRVCEPCDRFVPDLQCAQGTPKECLLCGHFEKCHV